MAEGLFSLFPFVFYGAVMLLAVAELAAPRRSSTNPASRRWLTNIGLFVCGLLVQRFCLPVSALVTAGAAQGSGIGLFNLTGWTNGWAATLLAVAALDLWKYLEHRLVHAVPVFWRLHLTHHSDTETDFTTTERHHPFETFLGSLSIVLAVVLLGISPLAVAIYVTLASAVALFSHANIRLPETLEAALGTLIVTPGVHVVHHSSMRAETDSNYGALLTLWDRLFRTYRKPDRAQEAGRVVGLEYFRDADSARIDRVLFQPFLPLKVASRADADRLPAQ